MNTGIRGAGQPLCSWVDRHITAFLPDPGNGVPRFRDIKPLAELGVVLWVLTSPRLVGHPVVTWAERTAGTLLPAVVALAARYAWPDGDTEPPAEKLVVFPVMEQVTGRRFDCHDAVTRALSGGPDTLEAAFGRDLVGYADCRPPARLALTRLRDDWPAEPAVSALYSLTHIVFFATLFGRRPVCWATGQLDFLGAVLVRHAEARLEAGDFDIAAELLLAMAWTGFAGTATFRDGTNSLAAQAVAAGCIPETRSNPRQVDGFHHYYHATLITLVALAEAALSS